MTARTRRRIGWLVVVLVGAGAMFVGLTGEDPPATDDERAYSLKEGTRCPDCRGQNVLESNAPVAAAIRNQIDDLVDAGRTDDEIRLRLAEIYGDAVNPRPPSGGLAGLVWVIPAVAVFGAVGALAVAFVRWRDGRGREASAADEELVRRARERATAEADDR